MFVTIKKKIAELLTPSFLTGLIYNFGKMLSCFCLLFVFEYSAYALFLGSKLANLPSIFIKPITNKSVTSMKTSAFTGNIDESFKSFRYCMKRIYFITIPFIMFIIVFKSLTIRTIFEGFNFGRLETAAIITTLLIFTIEMPFKCCLDIIRNLFCSAKRVSAVIVTSFVCLTINIAIGIFLASILQKHIGVLIGITISTATQYFTLLYMLRKDYKEYYKMINEFIIIIAKCIFSSAIAALITWEFYNIIFNSFIGNGYILKSSIILMLLCSTIYTSIYISINKMIESQKQIEIIKYIEELRKISLVKIKSKIL